MPARRIAPPPEHIYPPEPWRITESRFSIDHVDRAETFFSLANGYLGTRGTFEEGRPGWSPGTFVNGFHETWPIVHAEDAYGLARTGQTIVNVPDATVLKLYVDDEPLFLPVARMPEYERALDMRDGTLTRDLLWSTPSGKHVSVRSRRLVSLESRHVLATTYEVMLIDHAAPVVISSQVINHQDGIASRSTDGAFDPRLAKVFTDRVLNADVIEHHDHRLILGYRTTHSAMTLGVGVDHMVETDNDHTISVTPGADLSKLVLTVDARPGVPIKITKYAAYHTSRSVPVTELTDRARRTLDRMLHIGFDSVVANQRRNLDRFWERADIEIATQENGTQIQQAVRWNLFQLAQATWRAEGSGIPAKGLTGQAYEGHYFWDSEVYVLPFLAYTQPRIARNLLRFRHSMLDAARDRARTVSEHGALFPWRTINGEEASAYYQAGTAQYHINADIAYAIRKYVDVRGDIAFLGEVGGEMLVETARLWLGLGFQGEDGRFHIHGVTGPDEYTTVVNDNAYTNLMARLNLNYAASAVRRLRDEDPAAFTALVAEVDLQSGEEEAWEQAAATMYIPFDDDRSINPQDESFLSREVWDIEATPPDRFPLLLNYHPLVIYRYQVIKQADIVLAMFLLGNEFTAEQKRKNFEYYDPLTTGDSSLSAAVQSIVAAEIRNETKALEYFHSALMMDLGDVAGNVSDGVHIASTGGVWMTLVFGFAGVRDFDGRLSVDPRLPRSWRHLRVPIRFQDRQITIDLTHDEERYSMLDGEALEILVRGAPHLLTVQAPVVIEPQHAQP